MSKELLGMYKALGVGLVLAMLLMTFAFSLAVLLGKLWGLIIFGIALALVAPPLVLWAANRVADYGKD